MGTTPWHPCYEDTMVARETGSLMGRAVEVDQVEGEECMSRFLRVRIQMPIDQPLMRGNFDMSSSGCNFDMSSSQNTVLFMGT